MNKRGKSSNMSHALIDQVDLRMKDYDGKLEEVELNRKVEGKDILDNCNENNGNGHRDYKKALSRQSSLTKRISNGISKSGQDIKAILVDPDGFNSQGASRIAQPYNDDKMVVILNGEFLTLKILFVDMLLVVCNLSSDFTQGLSILLKLNVHNVDLVYGVAALGIIWLPGIPAAIHFLSTCRLKFEWYESVIYAMLLFLFYPIVPLLALMVLLWMKPSGNKSTEEFKNAQYGATVSYTIQGCISAPIQIAFQGWLAISGIMPFTWISIDTTFIDWGSNNYPVKLPSTAFCIIFSILR